jgi:hypothetical protein
MTEDDNKKPKETNVENLLPIPQIGESQSPDDLSMKLPESAINEPSVANVPYQAAREILPLADEPTTASTSTALLASSSTPTAIPTPNPTVTLVATEPLKPTSPQVREGSEKLVLPSPISPLQYYSFEGMLCLSPLVAYSLISSPRAWHLWWIANVS